MFSPMFDGQYRTKPQVSLRGASKKEDRGNLLKRAHQEREQRENVRHRHQAAIVIQKHFRGHVHRTKQHAQLCEQFDHLLPRCQDIAAVISLSRLLCPLYRENTDHDRLIKLCQKWLHHRISLAALASTDPSVTHHLLTLLIYCTASLSSSPSQNLAIPLRMLEIYLNPLTYPEQQRSKIVPLLCRNLVASGYFTAMRSLLEHRAPPPDETDHAHSPLADSILTLLIRPLLCMGPERSLYKTFALNLFSQPLTPHLCYIILPHLMTFNLDFARLLEAIRGVALEGMASPLDLLYASIQLLHSRLKSLSQQLLADYFHVVAVLLSKVHPDDVMLQDMEEDFDDVMSVDGLNDLDPLSSQDELLACCLSILCGREIPDRIRQERFLSDDVVRSLCSICFQLQFSQLPLVSQARIKLFRQLALQPRILLPIWNNIQGITIERTFGGDSMSGLQQLARGVGIPPMMGMAIVERLTIFSILFNIYLSTLHDAEFFQEIEGSQMPFSIPDLTKMVQQLRDLYVSLHFEKQLPHALQRALRDIKPTTQEWNCLKLSVHNLLCSLYERDCRRPFCPKHHWHSLHLNQIPPELFYDNQDGGEEEGGVSVAPPSVVKQGELLRAAPFVFPFEERVQFFTRLVASNRTNAQGRYQDFLLGPSIHVTARRDHIYEDAFAELAHGQDLRNKLRVTLVNAQGLDEPGIDGGGVFREFLNELLKTGFDPNRGYFTTTQDGQLYPNPQAHLFNEDYALHYEFLGSMLGKALYEGLLVELPFAGFFLCKLAGRGRGTVGVHHLASFDPELYRHLLSLKHYDGDIEDLDLNFTVTINDFGQSKVVELKPGGADIAVTRENSIEYLHLVAYYKLNVQLEKQFQAFRKGLSKILPLHWLRLFSQNEFQVLISGAEMPINISDLKKNTAYSGEYKEDHPCIKMFWEVISSFTEEQKQQLLKFVTSCSRPPLLGFKELHPPFHISPGLGDVRLPSASTCMNILKLPLYHDKDTMRNKVLYAIQSGAGFELS